MLSLKKKDNFKKNKIRLKKPLLNNSPQKRGVILRVRIQTPRKPNSARRPVLKGRLVTRKFFVAHIPGMGHNLKKHSSVLISGVGARDLPGVHYSAIRGCLDFLGMVKKITRRSIYAVKQLEENKLKIRRKLRQIV